MSLASAALLSSLDEPMLLASLVEALVPGLVDSFEIELLQAGYPSSKPASEARLAASAEDAIVSVAIGSIRHADRVLGSFKLVASDPERLEGIDDAWLGELGRRIGSALLNAEQYRSALSAVHVAEASSRAKDEFLATACHELRAPLNAIHAWLSLLAREELNERMQKAVEVVLRNAKTQQKLIEDILDVSRIVNGKLRLERSRVDLSATARHSLEAVAPAAEARQVTLTLVSSSAVPELWADAERLQQVLVNLLSNAIKFSDVGGAVRVALESDEDDVIVTITDNGRGIEADFLPYVFERLSQAAPSRSRRVDGLGIGLSLVRHIVELHGGHVRAVSEGLGKGTTMTVTLPIIARSEDSTSP